MPYIDNLQVMSKSRIESFSDGVFSIVLTLLVFNFRVPSVPGQNPNQELLASLVAMYPYCVTYALSFVLISMFWIAHHNLFHTLKHSDFWLLWLNNLFLLFLAFIPFPTQVLGAYPDTEIASIFFGIEMVLASLAFMMMRFYCFYIGKIADENITRAKMRSSLIKDGIGIGFYVLAIIISAFSTEVTLSMYALIPFLFFVPIHIRIRHHKKVIEQ